MVLRLLLTKGRFSRYFSNSICDFEGAYNKSGSLRERPSVDRYGTWKSLGVAIPFILFGGYLSMKGAAFLEEHDIFVPEDDD